MKLKNLFLAGLVVLCLPTKTAAITNETAGLLTSLSGLIGVVAGAALCNNPENGNRDAAIGALIVGTGTALIGGYMFYSCTPEARLQEAQNIRYQVQKNQLLLINANTQLVYLLNIKQIYLYNNYPLFEAYQDLIALQEKLKNARSLLVDALYDVDISYNAPLNFMINAELENIARIIKNLNYGLFWIKEAPEFSEQQRMVQQIRFQEEQLRIEREKAAQFARQAAAQVEANHIKWVKLHSKN